MPAFAFPIAGPFGGSVAPPRPSVFEEPSARGPIGRDLQIDPLTHDLITPDGDLTLVFDVAAIRQEVDIRLRFLLTEWFLDVTQGVPYLQTILVKAPNLAAVRTVLRNEILNAAGVLSITRLDLNFDKSTRVLTCTWSATTDLGELISSEVNI